MSAGVYTYGIRATLPIDTFGEGKLRRRVAEVLQAELDRPHIGDGAYVVSQRSDTGVIVEANVTVANGTGGAASAVGAFAATLGMAAENVATRYTGGDAVLDSMLKVVVTTGRERKLPTRRTPA